MCTPAPLLLVLQRCFRCSLPPVHSFDDVQMQVTLLWNQAPEMCALVAELASRAEIAGSRFYRNEAPPDVCSPD